MTQPITYKSIDELNKKLDITKMVGNVKLTKQGNVWIGRCPHPDHDDSDPSFRIWDKNGIQTWACFGCHSGKYDPDNNIFGTDPIAFIRWMSSYGGRRCSFQDAVKKAEKITGMTAESSKEETTQIDSINRRIKSYFEELKNSKEAKQYLVDRGLNAADIKKWKLGYHETRIMFPLLDGYGTAIGFNGRSIDKNVLVKYYIDPNSKIFNKSQYLYGLNNIDYTEDYIYITEGCFDVILADKYGLKNTVASMGTVFSPDHAKMIYKTGLQPVLVFDADNAGLNGLNKAVEQLSKFEIYPHVVFLPQGNDLADIANRYKDKLKEYIMQLQIPFWQFKLKPCVTQLTNARNRILSTYADDIKCAINTINKDSGEYLILKDYVKKHLGVDI